MTKKVIGAGMLGAVVLIAWTFVVNVGFGFQARIDMNTIAAERHVYEVLKENIVDPGRYIFNPEVTPEWRFPDGEPVFSVLYGGSGHEAAGGLLLVELATAFLAAIIGAWMLSQASDRVLCSYPRKVLFFTTIGLLIATFCDLNNFGIGRYPAGDAIAFAMNHIAAWTLVGLVVAWRMKPQQTDANS